MILIGRVTKDAVAINYYYKPKGSDKRISLATFVSCSYWRNTAIASRLTKGSLVEITGRLSVNAYTTMQGEVKASLQCHVDGITIHQKKAASAKPQGGLQDDLPF